MSDKPKPTIDPTDQDHSVQVRVLALEHTIKLICDTHLAGRVAALETDGVARIMERVDELERIVECLDHVLAKQRAVNEALLKWLGAPSNRLHEAYEPLVAAIRDTLK